MGTLSARSKTRGKVAVLAAAVLVLTAVVLTRSKTVEAHPVSTDYPLKCGMVGLGATFSTNHTPEAGTTPGGALVLHVHLVTSAASGSMTMPTKRVAFTLPKPALIQSVAGVTFSTAANFKGTATVDTAGTMSLVFTGDAPSNAIQLQDFDISAVTSTSAKPGEKVQWIGPSQIQLGNTGVSDVDTCTPASGAAIAYAPTVVLDPNCLPSTTMDDDHHGGGAVDDHHGGGSDSDSHDAPMPTTACSTTTMVMPSTSATIVPSTPTVSTIRPTTTMRPPIRTTTTMHMRPPPPRNPLCALIMAILCRLFHLCR